MCIAVPGKIIKIDGKEATVAYKGFDQNALVSDIDIKIGDFVMVQMGIIIKVLTDAEAKSAYQFWDNR